VAATRVRAALSAIDSVIGAIFAR